MGQLIARIPITGFDAHPVYSAELGTFLAEEKPVGDRTYG
jgi:hypothetical protein